MPLTRISLGAAWRPAEFAQLSALFHECLVAEFDVPPADKFQFIEQTADGQRIYDPHYLSGGRSDRFVLVVSRDHPLARREKAAFAEVLDYDFVGLDRASALQRFLADKASRMGRPLKLRVQLRSFDGVCRLVERNAGIGIDDLI